MTTKPQYQITVRAEPGDDVPVEQRLRRLLKSLLRGYGLRCTSILPSDTTKEAGQPDNAGNGPMRANKGVAVE